MSTSISAAGSYQIAQPTGVCAETGEALAPGSPIVATLIEREEDDGFDRRDYSIAAWERGARPPRLFSFWKTIVPDANRTKRLLVDDDVLLTLFERLADDEREQRIAFRFVLALILMRKKLLKYVGRKESESGGSGERWLVRMKGTSDEQPPIEVRNPHLSDDDVRSLLDQLSEIVQADL